MADDNREGRKGVWVRVVLFECIMVSLTGGVMGILVSIPVVWQLAKHPIRIGGETAKIYEKFGFEAVFPASIAPVVFWNQTLVVLVIGLLLSLYPVLKVLFLKPVEAMRA